MKPYITVSVNNTSGMKIDITVDSIDLVGDEVVPLSVDPGRAIVAGSWILINGHSISAAHSRDEIRQMMQRSV